MSTDLTGRAGTEGDVFADGAEFRGVSVLFADLIGSTDQMEELGAEEYSEVLRVFHSICNDAVRLRGGVVAQYQGDGIICYFGFPKASENDAVNAVSAALDILDALKDRAGPDVPVIQTRIGISSGSVMLSDTGDNFGANAVGSCINKASRLEAAAEPNSVLICEDTQKLVGAFFQFKDLGDLTLKGFKQEQRAFNVLRDRAGITTRFEALRGRHKSDLVGREAELAQLVDAFDAVDDTGGAALVVSAQPGLGKSRLLDAFLGHPTLEKTTSFVLQCSPEHTGTSLYPVARYLEWVAGIGRGDSEESRHDKLKRLFQSVWKAEGEELDILLDLLSPAGAENPIDESDSVPLRRARAFDLLTRMIYRSASGRGKFVVVFEDAHWADPSTCELLDTLFAESATNPVLMIVTSRNEGPFGPEYVGDATKIELEKLSAAHALELARQSLDTTALSDEQLAQIVAKSDGVPLFVEEYSDMFRSSGGQGLGEAAIPLTLGGIVQSKLDRLGRTARYVAQAASALGRTFDPDLAIRAAGLKDTSVAELTESLLAQNLVLKAEGTEDRTHLSFTHALVRDAVYGSIAGDRRKKLHEHIVELLTSGEGTPNVAQHVLADHMARAEQFANAANNYINAGLSAAISGAAGEALAHLSDALKSTKRLPKGAERNQLELQTLAIQGPTQMVTRGPGNPDFGATQARAMELVEEMDLHTEMVPVIYNTALHSWATAQLDKANTISEALHGINDVSPSDGAYMGAHTMRGLVAWHQGNNALAEAELSKTVERHDPEAHHALYAMFLKEFGVFSLFYLGLTKTIQGDLEAGMDYAMRANALGEQMGFPHERGFGMLAMFNTAMLRGDVGTADMQSAACLEYSSHQGFPEFVAMSQFVQGWVKTRNNNFKDGLAEMSGGLEFWAATGFSCWQALFAAFLARAQIQAGALQEAGLLLDDYLGRIAKSGENQPLAPLKLAHAELMRALDQDTQARQDAREALNIATKQGAELWRRMILTSFPDM